MIRALAVPGRNIKNVAEGKRDMMSYDEYEIECQRQIQRNEEFLKIFECDLVSAGLSKSTISKHLTNVDFYINTYLLRKEPLDMEQGCFKIDMFLGYFFILKCMWSTPGSIKTTAASIKKYYKCMLEHECIEKNDYEFLCSEIKEHMEEWQEDCKRYNAGHGCW